MPACLPAWQNWFWFWTAACSRPIRHQSGSSGSCWRPGGMFNSGQASFVIQLVTKHRSGFEFGRYWVLRILLTLLLAHCHNFYKLNLLKIHIYGHIFKSNFSCSVLETARRRKAHPNARSSPTPNLVCGALVLQENSGQPVAFIE